MNEHTTADTSTTDSAAAAEPIASAPVATLAMVTLDAPDTEGAAALGRFWSAVLGWPVTYEAEGTVMLQGPSHALGIGAVEGYQAPSWPDDGRKQFHLDLAADDIGAAAARCVDLGATRPDEQPGETWIVLLDPAGHPFCVTDASAWS